MATIIQMPEPVNYSTSIIATIRQGITVAKLWPLVILNIILIAISAVLSYYQGIFLFDLTNEASANNVEGVVKWILSMSGLFILRCILMMISKALDAKITIKLSNILNLEFLTMMTSADLEWLRDRKCSEDYTAIAKGSSSAVSTFSAFNEILQSVLRSISAIAVVFTIVGVIGLPSIVAMMIILGLGCKFLRDNYQANKKIEKLVNPIQTCVTYLSGSMVSMILNGNKDGLVDNLIHNMLKKIKMFTKQDLTVEFRYTILDIIHNIVVGLNVVWIAHHLDKLILIVPIYSKLTRACGTMWRLFHLFNRTARDASAWGPLEKLIVDYSRHHQTRMVIETEKLVDVEKCLCQEMGIDVSFKECKINGPSASGKSTFILNLAIKLFNKYGPVISFMEQNKHVIKSNNMTVLQYLTLGLPEVEMKNVIDTILELATRLNVSKNVISKKLLKKPLKKPSGGEENRIGFIQTILPIYLAIKNGDHIKPILLVDEATAGLDKETFKLVREIFSELRDEHGIKLVTIDHHEIEDDNITYLKVIKKDIVLKNPLMEIKDDLSWWDKIIEMLIGSDEEDVEEDDKVERPKVWVELENAN